MLATAAQLLADRGRERSATWRSMIVESLKGRTIERRRISFWLRRRTGRRGGDLTPVRRSMRRKSDFTRPDVESRQRREGFDRLILTGPRPSQLAGEDHCDQRSPHDMDRTPTTRAARPDATPDLPGRTPCIARIGGGWVSRRRSRRLSPACSRDGPRTPSSVSTTRARDGPLDGSRLAASETGCSLDD